MPLNFVRRQPSQRNKLVSIVQIVSLCDKRRRWEYDLRLDGTSAIIRILSNHRNPHEVQETEFHLLEAGNHYVAEHSSLAGGAMAIQSKADLRRFFDHLISVEVALRVGPKS